MDNIKEKDINNYLIVNAMSFGLKYCKSELPIGDIRIDIFAINNKNVPCVIELKKIRDRHTVGQVMHYLSIIELYKDKIELEINKVIKISNIKWNEKIGICIAPEFTESDYISANDDFIKKKVHLYQYNIIKNADKDIFSLNLEYK
ncbi:MAG: hypothetical protein LBP92_06410, partial [Deltaproteobacteria bacterium]|nr:hypothetical protein [Deltaproteobacteria bacterium]